MMAYRPFFGSGLRIADQFGNLHSLEIIGGIPTLKLGADATNAGLIGAAKVSAGDLWKIKSFITSGYIVKDAALFQISAQLPLLQRVGVPLYEAVDEQFWPKVGFGASMLPSAPPTLRRVGLEVRKDIQRNPHGSQQGISGNQTGRPGGPNFSPIARKMLNLIGAPGSRIDWKTLRSKAAAQGLRNPKEYEALQELEGWGAINVERRGSDDLNIISVQRL